MATKSTIPSSPSEMKTQNLETPSPDSSKPDTGVGTESSEKPSFLIPEPMREEQVQNAVNFLSHPKVRGSPVIYRRSFLEKKGLTKEEIDEAFRRVPDPSPSNAASVEATTNQTVQANQAKPSTTMQPQASIQTSQPAASPVVGAPIAPNLQQSRFHWSHALFAIGFLAASGAGTAVAFKKMVVPRFKAWIRKVITEKHESRKEDTLKSSVAEEAMEAAKAATTAATIAAKASQEFLSSKNEDRKFFEAFMEMMDVQVKEMKSMNEAIHKLGNKKGNALSYENLAGECAIKNGPTENPWRASQVDHADVGLSSVFSKQVKGNGLSDSDSRSVRSSSPPASVEPLAPAPHPKSYMEIMDMIRRGETPPGIKEINDLPPNPNQQPSKPLLAPKPKPWEIPQHTQQRSHAFYHQYKASNGASEGQENDQVSQLNGMAPDASEPWWTRKTVKITEIKPESEEPRQSNSYGMEYTAQPSQRAWVPPQPPAVVMPEAVAAIRQPKPSIQKQQSGDEQLSVQSEDGEAGAVEATDSAIEVKHSVANAGAVEATDSVVEMKQSIATTALYNSEIQEEETIDERTPGIQ